MTIPLPPVPGPEIASRQMLTPPWHSWFNQLYVYLTQPSSGGGGIVPASRRINTTAPLAGGGTIANDLTLSITANGVTNALLAQMPAGTIKGNNAVLGTPFDLTVTQVTAMLNLFSSTLQGLAPASGGGTANFLRADGLWQVPAGTTVGANPSASVGLAAINGAAATFLRSDGAPVLDVTIAPTWSGIHTWTNLMKASASPLAAATTQVQTGLAAYKPSDTTAANNTLTADATLQLTFNETGKYAFEVWLPFYEATLGTGGFQFDLGTGSATVANLVYGVDGFSTASVINAGITSTTTASSAGSVATSSSAPSWFLAKGSLSITGVGTLGVRWAQASTLGADPTTLKAGAYFTATKIAA